MSNGNVDITCRLFVGFGGSGGKTLKELAHLFANDREWASRSEAEAYFLLIDTDEGDIGKYETEINETLNGVGAHTWVRSVGLAEGVQDLARRVDEQLAPPTEAEKLKNYLDRFRPVYWFTPEGRPWNGSETPLPPKKGAAQCPGVSYFLSWAAMNGTASPLRKCLDSLTSEMSERVVKRYGTTEYSVDMYVVSGLAGGTGRGSWAITSMKICELLRSSGKQVRPTGIFFDQSCFQSVADGAQGQRGKMMVNSLTGISMITGWVQNDLLYGDRVQLSWPSFTHPMEPARDVMDMGRLVDRNDSQMGCSPIRQAWIIFGKSAAGRLANDEQYAIAASALYGRNVKSEVDGKLINTVQSLGSLGAAVHRVDVHRIQAFLKEKLLLGAATEFVEEPRAETAQGIASEIVRPINSPLKELGAMMAGAKSAIGEPLGTALLTEALKSQATAFNELFGGEGVRVASVNSMGRDKLLLKLEGIFKDLSRPSFIESKLREGLIKALGARKSAPDSEAKVLIAGPQLIVEHIRGVLQNGFPSGAGGALGDAHRNSIATALAVVRELKRLVPNMPSTAFTTTAGAASNATLTDHTAETLATDIWSLRSRRYLLFTHKLTATECLEKRNLLAKALMAKLGTTFKLKFEEWLKPLASSLQEWEQNLEAACRAASHVKMGLERSGNDAERIDQLFKVDADFVRFGSRSEAQTGLKATHVIQPVMVLRGVDQLPGWLRALREDPVNQRFKDELAAVRKHVLDQAYSPLKGGLDGLEDKELRRSIDKKWGELRMATTIPIRFMNKYFSLRQVLEELHAEWVYRFEMSSANEKVLHNLETSFQEEMGFRPEKDEHGYSRMDGKKVIEKLALCIGQRCRAQYVSSKGSMEAPDTLVFLPTDSELAAGEAQRRDWLLPLNEAAHKSRAPVKFHAELANDMDKVDARGNPFQILAVTFEGFQSTGEGMAVDESVTAERGRGPDLAHVTSLDYWRDSNEHEVQTLLDWTEDPNGKSWFTPTRNTFGIGYEIPAFVTNDVLRNCRWRPWAMDKEAQQEAERQALEYRKEDAIIYAMLSPEGAFGKPISRGGEPVPHPIIGAAMSSGAETLLWNLPLLQWDFTRDNANKVDSVRFTFARRAHVLKGEQWGSWGETFAEGDQRASLGELLKLFEDPRGALALEEIRSEAAHYFGHVLKDDAILDEDVQGLMRDVCIRLAGELDREIRHMREYKVHYEKRVERLKQRAHALLDMAVKSPDPRQVLAKHFGGV